MSSRTRGGRRKIARTRQKSLFIRYGDFVFKYRNGVFPVVAVLMILAFGPVYPGGSAAADRVLDAAGIALVLLGLAIRGAVIGLAYIKRGGLDKKVYADRLVVEGIFAHCRNPLYVGNIAMLAGLLVLDNNPWFYLLGGGFFLLSYVAIVAAEEHFLRGKFGVAYERYCREVSRWGIRLAGLRETFAQMEFNWRRVVYKDYSTFLTWSAIVIGVLAYQSVLHRGLEASRGALGFAAAGLLLTAGLAFAIRRQKKNDPRKV